MLDIKLFIKCLSLHEHFHEDGEYIARVPSFVMSVNQSNIFIEMIENMEARHE